MLQLEKLLQEVIDDFGKNEGYHIPSISWSEENMLSRYGEFQYWHNHIIISRLLNTDKISVEAVKSVIYHEYTHQLYKDHCNEFMQRMKLFKDYDKYNNELNDYFDGLFEFPKGKETDLKINAEDEILFCRFPFEQVNEDSYWQHLLYYNHYITGYLYEDIPDKYCEKEAKQVIWVIEVRKKMYVVGWAQNVQLYPTIQKKNVRGSGVGTIEFQFAYKQNEGKVLLPCNVFPCLEKNECPKSLIKQGICSASEVDRNIIGEIVDIVNSYDSDYIDMGIMDSTLDAIPGIITENVTGLIKAANEIEGRDRRFLIMNKAVSLEKSYRTYLHRGLAFLDCWIFDRALEDLTAALSFENVTSEEIEKSAIEKYMKQAKKAISVLE